MASPPHAEPLLDMPPPLEGESGEVRPETDESPQILRREDPPGTGGPPGIEDDLVAFGSVHEIRRSRDFGAGFALLTLGVLASVGIAAGWLEPRSGWIHPFNAPHVWLPFGAGLWFLRRNFLHEETQQRMEERSRQDRRDQDRLAIFKDCEDKRLVANVVLALARANDATRPAGAGAGRAVEDITSVY